MRRLRLRPTGGLLTVALLGLASSFLLTRPATGTPVPGMKLVAAANFSLTGTVSGLVPGVATILTITPANSYNVPITVTSLTVSVNSDPAGCSAATYLSLNGTAFTGVPLAVAVTGLHQVVPANGSASVTLPIELSAAAPNVACQNVTFGFDYAGTATYTADTTTVVTSSASPSTAGQSVTFSATVTPDPAGAGTPVGSVVFFECTAPPGLAAGSPASACTTSVALSPTVALNGAGVATLATSSLTTGAHSIFALFTPTDPNNFADSASVVFIQQVNPGGGGGGGGGVVGTTTTTTTTLAPTAPSVVLAKANNAAGTGYGPSEVAAAGATSVPYRVILTNPNTSPGVVSSLTDTVGSTTTPICPADIGTVVAPGGSLTCEFTAPVPTTTTTDTAVVGLDVNGVIPTATAFSTVFPPVKGVVVTATTVPGVPPTTAAGRPTPSGHPTKPTGPLAFTGAHIAGLALGALALALAGLLLSGVSRWARREEVAP